MVRTPLRWKFQKKLEIDPIEALSIRGDAACGTL
jgi:hypothetical protein